MMVTLHGQIRARQAEWLVSVSICILGLLFVSPLPIFDQRSFSWFADTAPQMAWGAIFLLVGVLRITGLIINGKRATVTSWMRAASSLAGFLIFMVMSLGFLFSGTLSTWLALYPPIAISELANAYFAAIDAGSAWKRDLVKREHANSRS